MARWERTAEGFAANLDGTDASRAVSFPRLELRTGPAGWECRCLLPDGRALDARGRYGSTAEAKGAVVARARAALGPEWGPALDSLSAPGAR
jgi:hypothetical protein